MENQSESDLPPTGREPVWTRDQYDSWKDYADRADVVVCFGSNMGTETVDEYWFITPETEATWPQEWLRRCLLELAGGAPHVLELRDTRVSWGASGANYEIVLTLTEGVMVTATYEGLRWIARSMTERVKEAWQQDVTEPSDASLAQAARYAVNLRAAKTLSGSRTDLDVRSIRRDRDLAVVELLDADKGVEYEVIVEQVGGAIVLGKVRTVRKVG